MCYKKLKFIKSVSFDAGEDEVSGFTFIYQEHSLHLQKKNISVQWRLKNPFWISEMYKTIFKLEKVDNSPSSCSNMLKQGETNSCWRWKLIGCSLSAMTHES